MRSEIFICRGMVVLAKHQKVFFDISSCRGVAVLVLTDAEDGFRSEKVSLNAKLKSKGFRCVDQVFNGPSVIRGFFRPC